MQNLAFSIVPIESIADDCVNCGICVKECAFLQEYGSPQKLAESWLKKENIGNKQFSFECSLCGLCHGVCPKKLDPSAMFLAMRRQLVSEGNGRLSEHNTIRAYEKRGSSSTFSWFHFPENCHTVLFPGCAFPGSRSGTLTYLFEMLQKAIPELGIVFDCCTKPSHDLGEQIYFEKMFGELCAILRKNSVTKVLVTCPNCYRIFREYGEGIEVETVYELLARRGVAIGGRKLAVTIHDPCGVRFSPQVQESIRTLMSQQGTTVQEMEHNCEKTYFEPF
jgi:Fe-S oxidoreductase